MGDLQTYNKVFTVNEEKMEQQLGQSKCCFLRLLNDSKYQNHCKEQILFLPNQNHPKVHYS